MSPPQNLISSCRPDVYANTELCNFGTEHAPSFSKNVACRFLHLHHIYFNVLPVCIPPVEPWGNSGRLLPWITSSPSPFQSQSSLYPHTFLSLLPQESQYTLPHVFLSRLAWGGRLVNRLYYQPIRALLLLWRDVLIVQELLSCTSCPIRMRVCKYRPSLMKTVVKITDLQDKNRRRTLPHHWDIGSSVHI